LCIDTIQGLTERERQNRIVASEHGHRGSKNPRNDPPEGDWRSSPDVRLFLTDSWWDRLLSLRILRSDPAFTPRQRRSQQTMSPDWCQQS
jgi:hypothetical protein